MQSDTVKVLTHLIHILSGILVAFIVLVVAWVGGVEIERGPDQALSIYVAISFGIFSYATLRINYNGDEK